MSSPVINQSTMAHKVDNNVLYGLVDNCIKEGLTDSSLKQIVEIASREQQKGTLFDMPSSHEYILKRLINACMSTDPQIREHSSDALERWVKVFPIAPNAQKLTNFITDVSNYKKGGNRKSQSDAFAAGRVLVLRALSSYLKNSTVLFDSLCQIINDFKNLEQEAIQACHLLSQDKILKLKFHSLSPKTESSRYLYKLLLRIKDPKSEPVSLQEFSFILETETKNYPKNSTVLYNVGRYLPIVTQDPMKFFRSYANKFLDNDSDQEADIHEIYSILTVLKGFLDHNEITTQNYATNFDKKIISVWLEQFRVLNKKMKSLAKSMSIKIQPDAQLAYKILIDLHQEGVYMDNVSVNHPFSKLYESVDVGKYWKYLYALCSEGDVTAQKEQNKIEQQTDTKKKAKGKKQKKEQPVQQKPIEQQQQEEEHQTFYNELQYFIKLRIKEMPQECICSTLVLLLNKYHEDEKEKQELYLCINLLNLVCQLGRKGKNKQKKLNKKMLIILNALNLDQLKKLTEEQATQFKKLISWVKKSTFKIRKDQSYKPNAGEIDFFNFFNCILFFCLIYPDEIETCKELQMVYKNLMAFYEKKISESTGQPTKKVKLEKQLKKEASETKPIHVLTDIFISLMTKPPVFLRKAIHNLFENIIPFLDQADIGNMLTVITTPDAEFIQQI